MGKAAIGTKFTGPAGFADTKSGTYWEVRYKAEGDELKLQKALLKHQRKLNKGKK